MISVFGDKYKILIFLSLIGLLTSIYLYYLHLKSQSPFCLIKSGCDFVLKSQYSSFLNIPVALWGIFYFGLILILSLVSVFNSKSFQNYILIFSLGGFLFALYLIFIQIFIIKKICQYCLIADSTAILIFIIALKGFKK